MLAALAGSCSFSFSSAWAASEYEAGLTSPMQNVFIAQGGRLTVCSGNDTAKCPSFAGQGIEGRIGRLNASQERPRTL